MGPVTGRRAGTRRRAWILTHSARGMAVVRQRTARNLSDLCVRSGAEPLRGGAEDNGGPARRGRARTGGCARGRMREETAAGLTRPVGSPRGREPRHRVRGPFRWGREPAVGPSLARDRRAGADLFNEMLKPRPDRAGVDPTVDRDSTGLPQIEYRNGATSGCPASCSAVHTHTRKDAHHPCRRVELDLRLRPDLRHFRFGMRAPVDEEEVNENPTSW